MHQRLQAPQLAGAVVPGLLEQHLTAKQGLGRGVAGAPEGFRQARVAGQLHVTELGLGLLAPTVSSKLITSFLW